MALIALEKEDIDKFMEYEITALEIAMEIQDTMGIYQVGKLFGRVQYQMGNRRNLSP